jgi:hypothetical protein
VDIVYARREEVINTERGGTLTVPFGSHWNADDPLVIARPDLFSDDPNVGLASSVHTERPPRVFVGPGAVEQATAAPGERRQTRRPGR